MNMLAESDRCTADKIRELMFTFEDLVTIDAAGIQTLVRSVDKKQLTIALKGASEIVRWAFFDNMSERAKKHAKILIMAQFASEKLTRPRPKSSRLRKKLRHAARS